MLPINEIICNFMYDDWLILITDSPIILVKENCYRFIPDADDDDDDVI